MLASEAETERFGRAFAACLRPGDLVFLEGDLGAGKTVFARAVAHALGVPEDEAVTSPTFALMHEYEARIPLIHADFYRLDSDDAVDDLGVHEAMRGAIALVEWGEKHHAALGEPICLVRLQLVSEELDARHVTLEFRADTAERFRALESAAILAAP
ncbi:MAG: tRNA (adenosine(37)-N6)-threonylcarbamoyltransferase complex ATPase subunit type 1 TsaE [Myxococcales bacterium]|nr:tRNA (adenosine(37)-N6)-threonylcarbamoyltransferase complex ATPase subunit type 1 TsaE [Myxococcales bacterium]